MRVFHAAFLLCVGCAAPLACGDDKVVNACAAGNETCDCFPNSSCNPGLACASGRCVRYGVGGAAGGPDGSSGSSGTGGGSGAEGEGGSSGCTTGDENCDCYPNSTCNAGLACASGTCVKEGAGGASGEGGASGASGASGNGGVSGTGGAVGNAGLGGGNGSGGSGGSGGLPPDTCDSAPASVVENFATCNDRICDVAGRSGAWYGFADTGVNLTWAVSIPGTGWVDRTCAAWAIGGPLTTGGTAYAGIGFQLAEGNSYNLAAYSGVTVALETDSRVWFTVKTASGGLFGGWLAPTVGTENRTLAFVTLAPNTGTIGTLDTSQITEFQFTAEFPGIGFGFAIHRVSLY